MRDLEVAWFKSRPRYVFILLLLFFFMLVLGIDDAGRGPLIGPMILAGVLWNGEIERKLLNEGIKDSKMLEHRERIRLSGLIKGKAISYKIVRAMPHEIDETENLNTLEAMKMAEVINALNVGKVKDEKIKVIVDCPSVNFKSNYFCDFRKTNHLFCKNSFFLLLISGNR